MKRIRIQRWGSQLLQSPRKPPVPPCPCLSNLYLQPHNHRRRQSTVAATASSPTTAPPPSIPRTQQPPPIPREELPSPPVQAAFHSTKLSALHARLSLPPRVPLQTLARTLVDASADPDPSFNNASLSTLGGSLLSYWTAEHLLCHYPRLPMAVLFAAQAAYIGPATLAAITREWGVEVAAEPGGELDPGLLQLRRAKPARSILPEEGGREEPRDASDERGMVGTGRPNEAQGWRRGLSSRIVYDDEFGELKGLRPGDPRAADDTQFVETAARDFVRAVVGAVYLHAGTLAAQKFFRAHVLSRRLDVGALFDFREPTRDLSRLCAREGFEPPVARLISETGRLSRHPVFVVGVYSGRDKLGESAGASLLEARWKAAAAALKAWYLYSPVEVVKPSEVEGKTPGKRWVPNLVDPGEVII